LNRLFDLWPSAGLASRRGGTPARNCHFPTLL